MGTWMFRCMLACAMVVFFYTSAFAAEAVPGEYVVQLKPFKHALDKTQIEQTLGAEVKDYIRPDLLLVKYTDSNTKRAIRHLNSRSIVRFSEPNFIYRASQKPNDPDYSKLWGLSNSGAADAQGNLGTKGIDINVEKAWDITTGSKDVVVAVIDTGVDFKIPDLSHQAWTNEAELNGKPGVDDDQNGFVDDIHGYNFVSDNGDSTDDHGHGSHCSGTIAGEANDASGVAGIAWQTKIMALKFLDASGGGTLANAIKAIDYARKNGATLMSNSWGGGGFSQALEQAIKDASAANIPFIAAAGNSSSDNDGLASYPASYQVENVVSVAAIDNRGTLADFSNYGAKTVHVAAPGVNIFSTTPKGILAMSGTSMATPHVSGVAALVLAHEPSLTPLELRTRLIETSRPLYTLRGTIVSGGLIDAYAAVTGTIPPFDANDPINWKGSLNLQISTAHPYAEGVAQDFDITVPGATRFALHFTKFETEQGFDKVVFLDDQGKEIGRMSGKQNDRFSPLIYSDHVKVRLQPDASINLYGFDIDFAKYE